MRISKLFLLFILAPVTLLGQENSQKNQAGKSYCGYRKSNTVEKGRLYFAFGYNKNWYSTSDVHVHDESGDYNFTLYNLKAKDRPHFNELLRVAISIPQYGYRLGYWMPNNKWGIELKFDHAKYVQVADQTLHLRGNINGTFYDKDTLVDDKFLQFEHTDGANFLMLNAMYRHDFFVNQYIRIAGVGKFGGGIVIPRSDVTLFGQRWNHCFHVAGQIFGAELGMRVELFGFFFVEPSVKLAYANFNKVLAIDDILLSHRFWDGMVLMDAGFQFPVGKRHAVAKN
jgi:hypothetical protein